MGKDKKRKENSAKNKNIVMIDKILNLKYSVVCILILSMILIIFTNQITLRDFPNSADEYAYLISAEIFSTGKLSVPSSEHKEFFNFFHIVNDGKFYGKYSPGWPFFLMFGVLIRLPWLVNIIFGILTLLIIYSIAKEIFSEKVGKIAITLMALNPFFIFNSASYFSHASELFFLSLFAYIYFKNLKSNKKINFFLMGLILGVAFIIRQLDPIAIFIPFFTHYIYLFKKKSKKYKEELKNLLLFCAGFFILFAIFLIYNYLQTGNPFQMPFNKYDPYDKYGFNGYSEPLSWAVENNIYKRIFNLNIWVPFCFLFIFMSIIFNNNYQKEYKYLFLAIFCSIFIIYFFQAQAPGNQYGPRYLYSSIFALFILMAIEFEDFIKNKIYSILIIFIMLNLILFIYLSFLFHNQINERMQIYDKVKELGIENTIIFLNCTRSMCAGTMPAKDLTRNGIYFNESVLYVHDLKEKNNVLMQDFPNRNYYLWNCKKIKFQYIKLINFWKSKNLNCSLNKINWINNTK